LNIRYGERCDMGRAGGYGRIGHARNQLDLRPTIMPRASDRHTADIDGELCNRVNETGYQSFARNGVVPRFLIHLF
jgi:hypothetical protein